MTVLDTENIILLDDSAIHWKHYTTTDESIIHWKHEITIEYSIIHWKHYTIADDSISTEEKNNTIFIWHYTGYKTFVPKCIESFDW